MSNFIEFYGTAHLNGMNVAEYNTDPGVTLKAENIETGQVFGERSFDGHEAAEYWFSNLPGINNVSRLDSALDRLIQ